MNLNPFHLGGPAFLVFYALLLAGAVVALRRAMRVSETAGVPPPPRFDDPYLIAWLRGGDAEAVRVATVALVDRGLLRLEGERLVLKDPLALDIVRRDIERAVLGCFRRPEEAEAADKDAAVRRACKHYRRVLEQHGLVAGRAVLARRLPLVGLVAAVLLGFSLARAAQALAAGRSNLSLLAVLSIVAVVVLLAHWLRRRTFAGDAVLRDLKTLFKRLKDRASSLRAGAGGNEVAMLAAVFGLSALSAISFPWVRKLYPPSSKQSSSSSSCGSSCGSSCSGGCGGGCGGE
ncbi:MAG: TIGR04222 domain-containing membrane protein [Rubrivivax sp.]|nr:TIGR04222 domain-containing membrane protein [Rubrivivax sp.]